jgi:GH25 family lysozyme M1 (1,4-beta-N-acetylmuramidase)/Tfp pilus assembly protein PilV
MKLNDEYYEEEHGSGSKLTYLYMVLIMSVVVLGVTALVFWVNQSRDKSDGSGYAAAVAQKQAMEAEANGQTTDANTLTNSSTDKLTSDQLDIWTLPDTGRSKTQTGSGNGTVTNQTTGETVSDSSGGSGDKTQTADELANGKTSVYDINEKETATSETEEETETDEPSSITVKHADGTKEDVYLDENIDRNTYDYSNLTSKTPLMTYSEDGKTVSTCGVDISASLGEVDFSKLKSAGVDFVMIKIGARGYSSGNIVMDANYEDNLSAAKKAGLDIGVYFCSQAVTKAEAREEADAVLDAIDRYTIKYPVAFVMENVTDDMARIEALDTSERTQLAKTFMDRVANSGYTPAIYGDLEWLMTYVDMSSLTDYDVWYAQDGSKPDYPYQFSMWQYSSNSTIKGIDTKAAMILSFKKYGN